MSELNIDSSGPGTRVATAVAAPGALVLSPPAPVALVEREQAAHAVPISPEKQLELQNKANAFAAELAAIDTRSPAFTQKIGSITSMGDKDMRAAASMSNRMLDRPAAAAGKGRKPDDVQVRVSNTLIDLRNTVTELDPKRADLTGIRKVLKWVPGGDKIDRYFAKYQSAQSHLNSIIKALASGQDDLRKDNAAIETEKANMWNTMIRLSEYNELATALDVAVGNKADELEMSGSTEDADTLRADALFPIRQRRQDIMTQMAVNVQGYMALDLVRKNNLELIRGVDRAQTTTIAALRIAVMVSQALSRQRLVLEQITALNSVTSDLIESTSQQLRTQGAAINEQAAASTIHIAKLQAAFDNVFATMDAVDTFRVQALDSMAKTVEALEGQIERAKPYLERTRRGEMTG